MSGAAVPFDLREAFRRACALDVAVRKPGNVSAADAGHGMTAATFMAAAEAASAPLLARGARVGPRIERAVAASLAAVGCNANLGIVLLCAPLARACDLVALPRSRASLRRAVQEVLGELDRADALAVYRAIARANPGGLGRAAEEDVHAPPSVNLREAMRLAAGRDSIARQYAEGFADLFDTLLPVFEAASRDGDERAMLATYVECLASWPDSHVLRKHGAAMAHELQRDARARQRRYGRLAQRAGAEGIAEWDRTLKERGINPGTSADLAVATAFARACAG